MVKFERLPLDSCITTSPFGSRKLTVNNKYYWWHNGIDFKADLGMPVYAVSEGIVKVAKNNKDGYGLYVALDHGEYGTLYAHLSTYVVNDGQNVKAGDIIGNTGNTGVSTAPHLHFEVRICDYSSFWDRCNCDSNVFMRCVDPKTYIDSTIKRTSDISVDTAIEIVKNSIGLADQTMDYIVNDYKYGKDLITKLAKGII